MGRRRYSTLNSSLAMRRRSSRSSAGESSGSPIRARSAAPIRAREMSEPRASQTLDKIRSSMLRSARAASGEPPYIDSTIASTSSRGPSPDSSVEVVSWAGSNWVSTSMLAARDSVANSPHTSSRDRSMTSTGPVNSADVP